MLLSPYKHLILRHLPSLLFNFSNIFQNEENCEHKISLRTLRAGTVLLIILWTSHTITIFMYSVGCTASNLGTSYE